MKVLALAVAMFATTSTVWADHNLATAMGESPSLTQEIQDVEQRNGVWCEKEDTVQSPGVRYQRENYRDPETRWPTAWLQTSVCYSLPRSSPDFCSQATHTGKKLESQYTWHETVVNRPGFSSRSRMIRMVFVRLVNDRNRAHRRGLRVSCDEQGD